MKTVKIVSCVLAATILMGALSVKAAAAPASSSAAQPSHWTKIVNTLSPYATQRNGFIAAGGVVVAGLWYHRAKLAAQWNQWRSATPAKKESTAPTNK